MIRNTFFILLIFIISTAAKAQLKETELQSSDYKCILNGAEKEYLSFDVKQPLPFTFLIKSDICQLLEVHIVAETKKYTGSGYLLVDGKLHELKLNEQYSAMIPQKVFYDPKFNSVAIVEFYLYSHIGTSLYRYAILTFTEKGEIYYDELDFNKVQNVRSVYKAYTNSNRVHSLLIPFTEED